MFGTVLNYVAMRLLGASAEEEASLKAQAFIKENGGALYTSSWAKFWLCLLGCMNWKGHNSVPPEMWLLPDWIPFHPGRLWCHCRMVYLPMCYLYGLQYQYTEAESDPLIAALRGELYPGLDYGTINWTKTRCWIAPMDNYSPIHPLMSFLQDCLVYWEAYGGPLRRFLRHYGLNFARVKDLPSHLATTTCTPPRPHALRPLRPSAARPTHRSTCTRRTCRRTTWTSGP